MLDKKKSIRMNKWLCGLLCVLSSSVCAEIFVAGGVGDAVFVYDNFDAGLDPPIKRVLVGPQTTFETVRALTVYTGSDPGSPTELYVCSIDTGDIAVFPVAAEGNVAPTRFMMFEDTRCFWSLDIYEDELFTGEQGVFVYDYRQDGLALDPYRSIEFDPPLGNGGGVVDIKVSRGEIFALVADPNRAPNYAIYVFDVDASGLADDVAKRIIHGSPSLDKAMGLWVTASEIFVATFLDDVSPEDLQPFDIVVFDREGAALEPSRTLSLSNLSSSGVMVLGDELFVVDYLQGIKVFNVHAGGTVAPKRSIWGGRQWEDLVLGANKLYVTPDFDPVDAVFELALEEPVNGAVHSGVSNLRGWSIANDGIQRVDIFVDGELFQSAPYGGSRGDVAAVFPDVSGALNSGFSLAYNYSALDPGEHTIEAVAYTHSGRARTASASFTVTRPGQEFIPGEGAVNLAVASCSIEGQRVLIEDMSIEGRGPWDALLEWRPAAQGFEARQYIFNDDGM